jgi:hypothetical protein
MRKTKPGYKLFHREPALWLALVYNIIMGLSAFVAHLGPNKQGALNATLAGRIWVITARSVARDGMSAAILGFVKALVALAMATLT